MTDRPRFHLAFPVDDLAEARRFYGEILGCREGRSDPLWVDFDLMGHQIVAHLAHGEGEAARNPVDGEEVPVRHFGLILDWADWEDLAGRLTRGDVEFIIEPTVRFEGKTGEQAVFFVKDPSGNALEFKAFRDEADIFAKQIG